jgi:hypothetical protein
MTSFDFERELTKNGLHIISRNGCHGGSLDRVITFSQECISCMMQDLIAAAEEYPGNKNLKGGDLGWHIMDECRECYVRGAMANICHICKSSYEVHISFHATTTSNEPVVSTIEDLDPNRIIWNYDEYYAEYCENRPGEWQCDNCGRYDECSDECINERNAEKNMDDIYSIIDSLSIR